MTTRRSFLTQTIGTSAVVSLGAAVPEFLLQAGVAASQPNDETILVMVQLSGGNDGLNTVAPFTQNAYRKARPTLAVQSSDALKIDSSYGFHPAAQGLSRLLEENRLSIIQGVGYANPNRSHFESMDIWHTCRRKTAVRTDGWLGRYLEANQSGQALDLPAIHLGHEKQPLALSSQSIRVPSVKSLDRFRLKDQSKKLSEAVTRIGGTTSSGDDLLGFVQSSTGSALSASQQIEAASGNYKPGITYPDSGLAQKLKTVAQLIDSGLKTRIYYVTLDGFDTHSRQAPAHAALLRELSGALESFVTDLNEHGHGDRVLTMSFSEFGRRLKENASEGTDHGAAAPVFLAGNRVAPGLIGKHPSLTDLQDGDVKFHTNFRQVYATILDKWLGVESAPILGGKFASVPALQS
ncbi:MAG: DUF1501 domain-containing protein [Planctomycetaceae bacterium]|jgi:uncharacterized protein (DUF1501 family)|nr:DUF1501 domain-containing protein [Planctomycetaceae bacterium]